MTDQTFSRLEVEAWRQFEDVVIDFHPSLTILTGTNGSGKSTLLSICNKHFGWQRPYLGTPVRDAAGSTSYLSGILKSFWHKLRKREDQTSIGSLTYTSGGTAQLLIDNPGALQYNLTINPQHAVNGVHIDSYRPAPLYSQVVNIPLQPMTASQAYQNYHSEVVTKYAGHHSQWSPIFRLKEALISMALFGEGNSTVGSNAKLFDTFKGFNDVLAKLLPPEIGFKRLSIRTPDVVCETQTGDFLLDAASGGLNTLIDIAWRIYIFSHDRTGRFSVTMDEPENHLHPSMQRSILRQLVTAFPNAQFIVATHSPFIVSSVKDSSVYVLRYSTGALHPSGAASSSDPSRRVTSIRLAQIDRSGTAGDILREVLGVPVTMPEWVEDAIKGIVRKYTGKKIDETMLDSLRAELASVGFSEYFPEALSSLH